MSRRQRARAVGRRAVRGSEGDSPGVRPAAVARGAALVSVAAAAALSGCAVSPTAPNVLVLPGPGKSPQQVQAEMATCRQQAHDQVAPQVEAINNQAAGTAVVGTAIGAAVGALFGSPYYSGQSAAWGAGSGLAVGSTIGAGNSQAASWGLQQRYDLAYAQCMVLLGYQVTGPAAVRRTTPAQPTVPGIPPPGTLPPAPAFPPPGTPPPIGVAPAPHG